MLNVEVVKYHFVNILLPKFMCNNTVFGEWNCETTSLFSGLKEVEGCTCKT